MQTNITDTQGVKIEKCCVSKQKSMVKILSVLFSQLPLIFFPGTQQILVHKIWVNKFKEKCVH